MSTGLTKPLLEPTIIVIFGITGDLSKRKLLPALYHLFKEDLLHEHTVIVGVTRQQIGVEQLLSHVELCVNETGNVCDPAVINKMRNKLKMLQLDITEGSEYDRLLKELNSIEDKHGMCMNRLYYLSIPPQVIGTIVTLLGEHGLNASCPHGAASTRLLIEKPFGYDLTSAKELIDTISDQFGEEQIFRIDHYLAKETVQNIVTFRFHNIIERLWDSQNISHILISATETIGIEGRILFYEQVGALRDIIQSHLIQLLAITTLDLPKELTSDNLHNAKLKLLKSIKAVPQDNIKNLAIRGQYKTYKDEVNNPNSETETFAAIQLEIDNERWGNIPILLRTGKAMTKKVTEVRIVFKAENRGDPANVLVFRLQPHEGIQLDLQIKKPSFEYEVHTKSMDFNYQRAFEDNGHPDAYERVLVDAVKGDHTLFATSQEVLESWRIVDPVLSSWSKSSEDLSIYNNGSDGPEAAINLAANSHITWDGKAS